MKIVKRIFITLTTIAVLYSGAWFFAAYKIDEAITQFYTTDAPAIGYQFYGDKPTISGFPFAPIIVYQKGFENDSVKITFDEISLTGFPLPTFPISLFIDTPLEITDKISGKTLDLSYLKAQIIAPTALPNSSRKNDIARWQQDVGTIDVKDFQTAKAGMKILTHGTIGLDGQLQPTLLQEATIQEHEDLIGFLVESEEIEPLPAAIALSALNAMVEINPETNQREVQLLIRVENRTLYLGPIRILDLPVVNWH